MQSYVGTKIIQAEPMDEFTFLTEIKSQVPIPDRENVHGYRVVYADGYVSWSPKATFEHAYRPITEQEKELI